MDKYKDNFDDDKKMEEYKFDLNDYCRFCNGHLRGIRHMVDGCRRKTIPRIREGYSPERGILYKREKESENDTEIANNELPRRPLELGVSKEENESFDRETSLEWYKLTQMGR